MTTAQAAAQSAFTPRSLQDMRNLIASRQVTLTPKLQAILRFAFEHPQIAAFSTVETLAAECAVSNSSVTRLPAQFGLENFAAFRELFRMEMRRAGPRR